MTRVTQPLRDEHQELLPRVESLRVAAGAVDGLPVQALREHVDAAYEFLARHLIPHARAEEAALYPAVAAAMGALEATATMSRDHVEVVRLVEELGARRRLGAEPGADALRDLRRVLYGLYALVKVHFAKEEVYAPLLDARLSPEAAYDMFERMESAMADAKTAAV